MIFACLLILVSQTPFAVKECERNERVCVRSHVQVNEDRIVVVHDVGTFVPKKEAQQLLRNTEKKFRFIVS